MDEDKKPEIKPIEKGFPKEPGYLGAEIVPVPEKKEVSRDEKIISEELRREIELMDIDENLKKAAEDKANKIQFLADDKKLEKLLEIAKEKGVLAAVQTAKRMNDPFLLDTLHDILAREGYYQQFIK